MFLRNFLHLYNDNKLPEFILQRTGVVPHLKKSSNNSLKHAKTKSLNTILNNSDGTLKDIQKNKMSNAFEPIKNLIQNLKPKIYHKGDIIIQSGQINNFIYILITGEVGVFSKNEQIAIINTPYHLIGEMSYVTHLNSNNDVIALSELSLIQLSHEFITQHKNEIFPFITLQLVQKLKNTNIKAYLYELANKELKKTQKILESAMTSREFCYHLQCYKFICKYS